MATTFIDSDELDIHGTGAVLASVSLPGDEDAGDLDPLAELGALAETAGARVVAKTTQKRERPDGHTFCGKGKAEEIAEIVRDYGARLLLFDNELKPSQQKALGDITGARVMDRTELILSIFAEHARTHQAKVSVEIERLKYQLPRLQNLWSHLERQRGAVGKLGGAGERQIETDRRIVRDRIHKLENELHEIERRREVEVSRRRDLFQVAIVGYTNAGKSTLMNALTGSDVLVEDKLFATLEARTRVWRLPNHHAVLLSDTVGFIRKLPHSLIASFHATLEEAIQADLLMHVVDASHPQALRMMDTVEAVLEELGVHDRRTLAVLNKADRVKNRADLALLEQRSKDSVFVSALSGAGLTALASRVAQIVEESEVPLELDVPVTNGKLLAFLKGNAKIVEERLDDSTIHMRVFVEPRWVKRIRDLESESAKS